MDRHAGKQTDGHLDGKQPCRHEQRDMQAGRHTDRWMDKLTANSRANTDRETGWLIERPKQELLHHAKMNAASPKPREKGYLHSTRCL
jgi:hypothetical protein